MAFSDAELIGQFADTVGKECAETMKKLSIEQAARLSFSAAEATALLFAAMDRMLYHIIVDAVPPAAHAHVIEALVTNACENLGVDLSDDEETVQ